MAWQHIHSFTSAGTRYSVQWNRDSDAVRTVIEGTETLATIESVTYQEYGRLNNYVMYSECRDGALVMVRAQYTTPFANVRIQANSPYCAQPVCDLQIIAAAATDETEASLKDGTVSIVASASQPIQYSLDGSFWQSSNYFSGLGPGNYIAYARTNANCQRQRVFAIAAGQVPEEPTYPSLDRPCHFFRLIYLGITYPIDEPLKWDGVNFVGSRSKDWHGYRGMWSDGVVELEFDCAAGKTVLEQAYNTSGADAEVLFQYGYIYKGKEHILFPGRINLNTYKRYPGKIAASVEREDFNQALLTRFDTKVSMAETKGLDGTVIAPPAIVATTLHAKEVQRRFIATSQDVVTYEMPVTDIPGSMYLQPNTIAAPVNEIEDTFTQPLGASEADPVIYDKYLWLIKYGGTYSFNVAYSISAHLFRLLNESGSQSNYTVQTFFQINNTPTQIGPTITGNFFNINNRQSEFSFSQSVSQAFPNMALVPGDRVYIFTRVMFGNTGARFWGSIKQTSIDIRITSLENAGASPCRAWLLYDVINHCTQVITNGKGVVLSQFFSLQNAQQAADGEGSLYLLTNGRQLRQFDVEKNPLIISLKTALEGVKNIFGLGYGIERSQGRDVVRIERIAYFYQDKEIIVIDECFDYVEEAAKDLLYNEVETGYDKYQDSGYNTLDEFNTKHEYLTPVKTNKLKIGFKSSLIASGYAIESSRRQQFAQTATDSFQNDEDAFIIAARRHGSGFLPEKNEPFLAVENLISPETAYNLRITPLRILLNWAVWLKGAFFYKTGSEVIKKTFVAQNGELVTQLQPTDRAPVGDINRLPWKESQDVMLENYTVGEKVWRPEYLTFKCRLTPDKVQLIDKRMRGAAKGKNYGYILVKNPEGVYEAGWLFGDNCLEYNYATEKATFKLLRKWNSPLPPDADCCDYLTINGCYLKINGNKIIV